MLNAIVGFAGLESTLAALESGVTVALANKESLVCAGDLVNRVAARQGLRILPVDSEHSALFQLVAAAGPEAVDSLVITASGGPFRGRTRDQLVGVTREQALAHPTWSMGEKISIDSATLVNKGLEVIEAHHLFGLPYERIEVVVHPQSLVHALVRLVDGALLSHLGCPDMRVPISFALHFPERARTWRPRGSTWRLVFPWTSKLPMRPRSPPSVWRGGPGRGGPPACAFNAANEVAVRAFLDGRLLFLGISEVVDAVVAESAGGSFGTYEEVAAVDSEARAHGRRGFVPKNAKGEMT